MHVCLLTWKAEFLSSSLPWWRQRTQGPRGRMLPVGGAHLLLELFFHEAGGRGLRTGLSWWMNGKVFWKRILKGITFFTVSDSNIASRYDSNSLFTMYYFPCWSLALCLWRLSHNMPILLMILDEHAVTFSDNLWKTFFNLCVFFCLFVFHCKIDDHWWSLYYTWSVTHLLFLLQICTYTYSFHYC